MAGPHGFDVDAFHTLGFATIPGALDGDAVAGMRARLSSLLRAQGIDEDEPPTWPSGPVARLRDIRRGDLRPADAPAVRAVVDTVFGSVAWKPPSHWGQALVAFPEPGPWSLPRTGWHCDFPFWFPPDAVWGVVVFLFLDDVGVHGGAALALAGSPEVVRQAIAGRDDLATVTPTAVLDELWARHPRFATTDPEVLVRDGITVDGCDLRVVELTGRAGDAVVCHPWLLHRASANTSARPRLQRAARVLRRFDS